MIKRRRSSAKAALGQQGAELKRSARGKRFVGDDVGAAASRAAERATVMRMQLAAREAAMRAAREQEARQLHEEKLRRPLWEGVAGLVLDSARLATTLAAFPVRIARGAVRIPLRMAAAIVPGLSHA